jgi:hypothetical protein
MWIGVTRGLAGIKFSASMKEYPYFKVKNMNRKRNTKYTNKSLTE